MGRLSNPNTIVGGRLLRGVVVGLSFEAATGLAIYAAWHLWRFIH